MMRGRSGLGGFLLLLVHRGLLLVRLGLGASLGLLALLGALARLRLALGLQRLVVADVTGGLLDLALGLFENTHGHTFAFCAARSRLSRVSALALWPSAFACSRIAFSFSVPLAC